MTELRFIVPGKPVTWKRPENRKSGGRRNVTEHMEWQAHAAFCASVVKPQEWPMDREYSISLHVVRADHRSCRDLDRMLNNACDALKGILWDDDSQIARIGEVTREVDRKNQRVEVTVEVIS